MRFGKFVVVGYEIIRESTTIILNVKCDKCNEYKKVKLKNETILKIRCKKCGRVDVVLPINYYSDTNMVKDTVTISQYEYRKLRSQFTRSNTEKSELNFIIGKLLNN